MPIYEYKCRNCGDVEEKLYKHNEKPHRILCPHCGDIAKRIPSIGSFHLKGGNWAAEGYGNKR